MTDLPASLDGMLQHIEQRAPRSGIELGLERVRRVLRRLSVHFDRSKIISIAGTNGKGSTVAFLEAIAARAGITTLAFTSPHLVAFGERFRFNGQPGNDEEIAAALRTVEQARGEVALTWFEHVTLAAFVLASSRAPEWLILEVGMGGRLDAVNVVDADVAVITSIGLDHQRFLGSTRAAIAREKCGIARAGRPVFVAEKRVPDGMLEGLDEMRADVRLAGRDFDWRWRAAKLTLRLGERVLRGTVPGLVGRHQAGNAAAAASAALALAPALDDRCIVEGLASARLAGRFERVARAPDLIVDVAHNPAAARALAAQLQRVPGDKLAVFAALEDKDIAGIVRPLAATFQRWYAAGLDVPRGLTAGELIERMGALTADRGVEALESVSDALDAARTACRPEQTIVVFGSFMTAAAALQALERYQSAWNSQKP